MAPRRWARFLLPGALLVGLILAARRPPAVSQPVAFNHRKHTADLGLGCEFCHPYVQVGAHSGLPGGELCAACHATRQGDSPEAARLTDLLAAGTPLRFNKLFRLAPHVNYTHRRHVAIAGLECATCHGPIASTDRPPNRPLVRITMKFCVDCHAAKGQSTDCVACHR